MTRARLYYELHVTVEEGKDFGVFREICDGWKVSRFAEDDVDGMSGKWFISLRCVELSDAEKAITVINQHLTKCGYTVLRSKIEDTIFDTKYGDTI